MKQYDEVVNDQSRPSFSDKLGALKDLNAKFTLQDEKNRILEETKEKIQHLKSLSNRFEQNNADFSTGIEEFVEGSEFQSIKAKRPG